jgi:hypothetical protein
MPKMRLPDPRMRALVRFLAVAFVLTCVATVYQDSIVNALLPLFHAWLGIVDDTYRTIDLSVARVHGESMIRRLATPGSLQIVGGAMVYPDSSLQFAEEAATGMVLQPMILALALLAGWPWVSLRELTIRFAVAVVPVALVMLLDVPMMLYGLAWFDELKAMRSEHYSILVYWADAMNAGGRFALAVVAVFVSVALGAAISSWLACRTRQTGPAATGTSTPPPSREDASTPIDGELPGILSG